MEKEFVPYELALRMKALGFDEPCISFFEKKDASISFFFEEGIAFKGYGKPFNYNKHSDISRPTFSQAFRWFREKYGIGGYVRRGSNKMHEHLKENGFSVADYEWCINKTDGTHTSGRGMKDTYEEAELACLKKLIEIIKTK